ncbi:MAG: DNA repair protein RecN [Bacteroidetes bacterium]|nr:MAG: DNA repair protein RecN [Bacteroidota bacterium]
MLQKLTIQNYAIIDELEIDFSGKLNILTGETGAGKSIILGALGLILGERADSSVLVNKTKKSVIEGLFDAHGKKEIKQFLEQNDFDITDELVIRREIAATGKSRAFINDTPVTLNQLNELSSLLVDLHQQFDTLELGESHFQREVLDALAGHADLLSEYSKLFNQWKTLQRECDDLKQQKLQFDKESDYNKFQFNELDEAAFRENELEETEAELKLLSNAEGIKSVLGKVYQELQEGESPVVQQLKILVNQLQNYSSYHARLPELIQRLQSTQIELQDVADEIDGISNHINYSPERIEQLNERLSLGYKLLKKHGVKTTAELLQIRNELESKLQAVLNIDETIQQKEKILSKTKQTLSENAQKISDGRKKQAKPLEDKVNKLLVQVGMPNAKIKVEIKSDQELNAFGTDSIEFLFDANRSGQYHPIRKVASGGELSRLMLCIKSLVAKKIDLPTMIFDEIDTGISGEAARQVGVIMKDLAASRQVICITHQPQIAGKADAHYFVYKEIVKDAVKTNIRKLTTEERITTIAKMLSGEKPTVAAIENAREMVSN